MSRPTARSPRTARSAVVAAADVRVVLSSAPPRKAAAIARRLVKARAAACVTVVPGATSVYRWKGAIESSRESLLLVKTSARSLARCLRLLAEAHPYEVPEGLVLTPGRAFDAYRRWVVDTTAETGGHRTP